MQFDVREPLHQTVREWTLDQALDTRHLPVWNDHVRRALRASDLLEPAHDVGGLDTDDLGAEVDGVVEGLLDVPRPIERLTLTAIRSASHRRRGEPWDRRGSRAAPSFVLPRGKRRDPHRIRRVGCLTRRRTARVQQGPLMARIGDDRCLHSTGR